jgi:ADP-heptose:LPS heptosyltransferase
MNAAKQRFPDAEIALVGPHKNAELFAADPQVRHLAVAYGRSSLLRERLEAAFELKTLVDETGTLVLDPDSRLTQLGLIPVCDDARYYFFESRGYGGDFDDSLPQLAAQWARDVFEVEDARPYAAPVPQPRFADITVSLGVGENATKRLGDEFERELVRALVTRGGTVLLDRGAGGEEANRVNAIAEALGNPASLLLHDGSYASFASHILQSKLYVGYDSAGQHVACAGEVPLVSVFAGYACDRMFQRWRPVGPRSRVVRVGEEEWQKTLARTLCAIEELAHNGLAGRG